MRPSRLIRNRLLGASRRLLEPAARWRDELRAPEVTLAMVQRRLELLLGAMYGQPMRVVASGTAGATGASDVVLPASLPGHDDALERYRLLAIEQGARVARGTRRAAPTDPLERDLYQVIEGASIDADIVRRAPGLRGALQALRSEELGRRPGMHRLMPQQREVERPLRALLSEAPDADAPHLPRTATAEESAERARAMAARIRETETRITYRPLTSVELWDDEVMRQYATVPWGSMNDFQMMKLGVAASDDGTEGTVEQEEGSQEIDAPDDARGKASTEGERTAAGSGRSRDDDADPLAGGEAEDDAGDEAGDVARVAEGIAYPEWIERHGRLEPRHTTVRPVAAAERDDAWARDALREHGPLVRQVRDRFALLRAQRMRLRAQRSGDELDLDACVNAMIDVRLGQVPSDRLYQTSRVTRHALAIAILVDVSGSTKTLLPDGRTVLDVERLSLLMASEALDALGDPYGIFTFSGLGRHDVRMATVKGFTEHDTAAVHRRISSLEPEDNTRLGAAVRHATALLASRPSERRVLLILSDGRPNDVDRYQGSDAIEDSRQAILAARAAGVHSFCLTVDAEEADYLPRLFGEGGYRVINEPAQLPAALIRLVDRLLRG